MYLERFLPKAPGFVRLCAHAERSGVHRFVVFEHPRELGPIVSGLCSGFVGAIVEDRVNTPVAIIGVHAHQQDAGTVDLLQSEEQFENACGEETAILDLLEENMHIRQCKAETDRLSVRGLREVDKTRIVDKLQRLRHELEFAVCHGNEAPVLFPRGIVDFEDPVHFAPEIILVEGTDAQRQAFFKRFSDTDHAIRELPLEHLIGYHVLCLQHPPRFHESIIVRRVVRHHEHRRRIEALDQHADLVIDGEVHRPANGIEAARLQKTARVVEERAGNIRVVDRIEESEESDFVLMELVMQAVEDGTNPSEDFAGLRRASQIGLDFTVIVERVFRIETGLDVYKKRGNPRGISGQDLPGEAQKLLQIR
jgi:hypothetical protein